MAIPLEFVRPQPARSTPLLLLKWLVALFVPLLVFTLWTGEGMVNNVWLWFLDPANVDTNTYTDTGMVVQTALFVIIVYAATIALAGYLVAADSGRRGLLEVWADVLFFIVAPLALIAMTQNSADWSCTVGDCLVSLLYRA